MCFVFSAPLIYNSLLIVRKFNFQRLDVLEIPSHFLIGANKIFDTSSGQGYEDVLFSVIDKLKN